MARLHFNTTWEELVKYDPRHFMGNWFLLCQSKSSGLFRYFCTATSDGMFEVREGERERVKAHLRTIFKQKTDTAEFAVAELKADAERVDALIKRVPRRYWRGRCRYTIPRPERLACRLLLVYEFFKDLDDPETGQPFFHPGHGVRVMTELAYVAAGYLSDHPSIELYAPLRELKTGFQIYRCLRTSSALEGYHYHLEHALAACAKACSLRYTDLVLNEFDWRWVVRALRVAGVLPSWVQHYNLALYEEIYDLGEKLWGKGGGARTLPGWRRTKLMNPDSKPVGQPLVRQGIYYGLRAQGRAPTGTSAASASRQSESAWLGEQLGATGPLHERPTAADLDALMDGDLADPNALSQVAFDHGLHLPPTRAEALAESLLIDERARKRLEDSGYAELQQRIRTRAPARPDAASLPQPRRTLGTALLPGPNPGMAAAARRPEVLEPMEEAEEVMEEVTAEDVEEEASEGEEDGETSHERNLRLRREWHERQKSTAKAEAARENKRLRKAEADRKKKAARANVNAA